MSGGRGIEALNASTSGFAAASDVTVDEPPVTRSIGAYSVLCLTFFLFTVAMAVVGGAQNPRIAYLCLLFFICASPYVFARPINGRYAILAIFLTLYFLFYGIADVMSLFPALGMTGATVSQGIISTGELAVLVGAAALIAGYFVAARPRSGEATRLTADWPARPLIVVAIALWAIGIGATWFWASEVVDRYVSNVSVGRFEAIGIVIARMVQPLGVALLTYRFVVSKSRVLLAVILAILAAEFVFGFLADSKELSVRGAVIFFLGLFLLDGRLPKKWALVAGVLFLLSFAVFQAYRLEVLQLGGQSRASAAANLGSNLSTALNSDMLENGFLQSGAQGLVGRISLKPTMEMIVTRVGKDVALQDGYTLELLLTSFVPRLIWPDKPDSSVGQLFNRQFSLSLDPDTYITATHLGELYWNFGWPGLTIGMFAIGLLLGFVNSQVALSERKSVTRFLILVVTIYLVCLRFEGGIALQYAQWIRSVGLILMMHLLFARVQSEKSVEVAVSRAAAQSAKTVPPLVMTGAELLARVRR